jgi:Spy/CpxP family protein refolding chaperone
MKNKILGIMAAAAIIVILSGQAFGFSSPLDGKRMNSAKMFEKMAKDIGLTDQQKDKFMAAAKQVEEEAKTAHKKNRELFGKVEEEIQKDAPDRKLIQDYVRQINQNNTQIQLKRLEQIIQMRRKLTPEQKGKMDQLMQARKKQSSKQRAIMHGKWENPSSEK